MLPPGRARLGSDTITYRIATEGDDDRDDCGRALSSPVAGPSAMIASTLASTHSAGAQAVVRGCRWLSAA